MLMWWAAFFVIGATVRLRQEWTLWCAVTSLLPLVREAVLAGTERRNPSGRLRSAALTAVTGCVVCQYASGAVPSIPVHTGRPLSGSTASAPAPVEALRDHIRSVCASTDLSERSRGMLLALLLADRTALDPGMRDRWRRLGISHFLALSGLHLGIVALPIYRMLSMARLRGGVREAAAFLLLAWYAAAAGAPLSLMRAASLLFIVRAHRLAGRPVMRDEAIVSGAFLVCLLIPSSTGDAGFMLSVSAAAGVLLVGAPLGTMIFRRSGGPARRAVGYIAAALCVSVSAMLYTLPAALRFFGRASLVGPLLSIVVAPLMTVFLYAGFVYAAAGHMLGAAGAMPVNLLARIMTALPERFPTLPAAAFVRGDIDETVFVSGAVILAASLSRTRPRRFLAVAGVIAIACSFLIGGETERNTSFSACDTLAAGTVLDRGRSTLIIEGPLLPGRAVAIYRRLLECGVRALDLTIVTDGGCLSSRGLSMLCERVSLRRVIVSPWLVECANGKRTAARRRIEPLRTVLHIEFGDDTVIVSGPRRTPGSRGVFSRDDTRLRISLLDSGGV